MICRRDLCEIDKAEHPMLKRSYKQSKEKILEFSTDSYEEDGRTPMHVNMTCFVSMYLFEEGFKLICVDCLEYCVGENEI